MYPGVHAQTIPDKPAVIMAGSGRVVTYRQLDDGSAALASALHGLGLRKGDVVAMLSDNAAECFASYGEFLAQAGPRLADQPRGSDMLYSSGTTGRPKGVRPPLPPLQVDQPGDPITGLLAQTFKVGTSDVYLSPAPIYHAAPLKWSGAVQSLGGTVVMMERFDAEGALAAIEQHGITLISTPEWLDRCGSVGRAAIGVAHVCDDDGNELPPGEIGSVYFERETRPFEYHKDPEKTKAAEHPSHPNWTTVGDLG